MLPPEVASGSGAIKVTPEVAKQLAQKVNAIIDDLRTMKREAENAYQEHDAEINDLLNFGLSVVLMPSSLVAAVTLMPVFSIRSWLRRIKRVSS